MVDLVVREATYWIREGITVLPMYEVVLESLLLFIDCRASELSTDTDARALTGLYFGTLINTMDG